MAEVLGVVASGIAVGTLAGKVASCVVKLKGFWDQVKDAPAEISYLVREIDTLNLILIHMQEGARLPDLVFNNAMLNYSLRQCEEGVNELDKLVQELTPKLEGKNRLKRKVGAAKVVLKQDDLNRFKSRMESAIRMLSLAYQCHTSAMIQLQPELIVARVAQHLQVKEANEDSSETTIELIRSDQDETPDSTIEDLVTRQYDTWISSTPWMNKLKQDFEAKYCLPFWISQKALHVQGYSYLSQWRINYQAYRLVPWESPFFEAIRSGDVPTVQRMIADKSAFVTDRSEKSGQTALHIAVIHREVEMTKLLLAEGGDPTPRDDHGYTPFETLICSAQLQTSGGPRQSLDVCRLLLNSAAINQIHETDNRVWFFEGSIAMFKYVRDQMYPPYRQRPLAERMNWVMNVICASCYNSNGPALVDLALGFDSTTMPEIAGWPCTESGESFLHLLALALSRSTGYLEHCLDTDLDHDYRELIKTCPVFTSLGNTRVDRSESWAPLIRRVVKAGSAVHALARVRRSLQTPLAHLLDSLEWSNDTQDEHRAFRKLEVWVTALYECEKDLYEYGEKERELGTFAFADRAAFDSTARIVGITYGPHPSDWRLWFNEPTDRYAGDFWRLIEEEGMWEPEMDISDEEDQRLALPGAWKDDDED